MKTLIILLLLSVCLLAQNQPRDQNIVAGEYFINNDPGEGNGIPLSSTYGFYTADVSIPSISINDVAYIRFKSSNGTWDRRVQSKINILFRQAVQFCKQASTLLIPIQDWAPLQNLILITMTVSAYRQ